MNETRNIEPPKCDHAESLYGRCAACGMTWTQQAAAARPYLGSPDAPLPPR